MVRCDRGLQMLLTTAGAFAAFSLMAIAIGTDYWLYSNAHICNGTNLTMDDGPPPRRARGDLTHSGLWRVCCIEGMTLPPLSPAHAHTRTQAHAHTAPGSGPGEGWARRWLHERHKEPKAVRVDPRVDMGAGASGPSRLGTSPTH